MANKILGITIDVEGKSDGLVSSLKKANSALASTTSAMKDLDKALAVDPSNIELLTQKQKLLTSAITETEEKLAVMRQVAEDAAKGLEAGTVSQEQYASLTAEIVRTEASLGELTAEAEQNADAMSGIENGADSAASALETMDNKAGEASDALGNIASKAQETGEALNKHVTEPLVKLGKASISAFNEVDDGFDIVIKKTGITGDELDGLKTVYENVFGSMPVSAEQAGSAVGEINTRMGLTGQALEDMTKEFLRFSNITDADVSKSVASVDKIMTKFGLDSSQTSNVLGLLTRAAQQSGVNIDTLTSTLESNGASLKEMGFDLTESVNLLSQFEENGVDACTAIAAFKKEVMNSTKAGQDAESALRNQIEAIKNAKDETEALQIATALFGGKGAPEMTQAIREGRLSVDDLSTSLSDYGSVVTDTFEATQDPPDQAKVAFNNLKLAGAELGESVLNVLAPAFDTLADAAKGVKDWFDDLDPTTQQVIVTIALLAATIGPLLIVIAKVITAVQVILGVLPAVKAAIVAVNAALAANPIALVVLAIAGLVAAFVALWNNCEEFREFWIGLWEALQEGAETVIEGIEIAFEQLGEGFAAIGDGIMLLFENIGEAFSSLGETMGDICTTAGEAFSSFGEGVQTVFENMWNFIKDIINTIIGGINGMIAGVEAAINFVIGGMNKLHWEIPSWVPGIGGYGFGFDIPSVDFGRIEYLAKGAVIEPNNPFLAVLGDQTHGTNIEAPLDTIKEALIEAMKVAPTTGAFTGQIIVPVYIGQQKLDTVVAQANRNNTYISGGR